jgi:aspartate aminotransferase
MNNLINENVLFMQVSGVRKMFELASKVKNPIDLSLGLPDYDIPDIIKEEAINAIKKGFNKYTPTTGIIPLKKRIVQKLKEENSIIAEEDEIIVTGAVSGALSIILTTIINKGDEIIIIDPYFVGYKQLIIQNSGLPIYVNTNKDFSLDIDEIEKKITNNTKAILINSPNNPTGKVYSKEDMIKLAEISKKKNIIIISDEIYEKFCYEKKHFSIGSIYSNTITLNGFSKSHAMTGWRIGYCHGPKKIIEQAIKVQQFNFVSSPTPFQYAAIKALDYDIKEKVIEYKKKRDIIYNGLKDRYDFVKSEGAFYYFIKYPYHKDKFIEDCINNSLLVVPGSAFSEKDENFRLSFANKDEILLKAIEILNNISFNE